MTSAAAPLDLAAQRRRGRLYVVGAALAWSTAGLLQRELSLDIATQLAGRAFFAVLGILAYVAVAERGRVVPAFRRIGRAGVWLALLTAIASASFIVALNHASVANVLFMQALSPILAAALGSALGEAVSRRTWFALGVALGGVTLMVGGPGHPGALGAALSIVMAIAFAGSIVITRHRRHVSMVPATCLSQLLVFLAAAPFAHPGQAGGGDVGLLFLLGVGQIGLGLIFMTIGARLIPAAEVALITLLEIVLGPLWVWIFLSEQPSAATVAGGVIVLGAVVIQVSARAEEPQIAPVPPP
ncbi:MAG: DMT family transporter [Actinomycetota bacterium]|nr:DMT family transporter [Actinomycetota bacterium]